VSGGSEKDVKRPAARDIENRPFMEGEGERVNSRSGKGKKANPDPGPIQEYDFFVTQDGIENQDTPDADRPTRVKKKCGRKKSTTFFVSE
jgi:hypothetical protein